MGYGYRIFGLGAAATIALGVAGCGNSNAPAPANPASGEAQERAAEHEASDEAKFAIALLHAAYDGEEELAQLATDRAQSERVRAHAEDLLIDYDRLEPQIEQVAEQVGVDLEEPDGIARQVSTELDSVYSDQHSILQGLDQQEFDRAYLSSLVATHQATIAELERIEPAIEEPEVRELVQSQIPLIERQLERARDVAEREGIQVQG